MTPLLKQILRAGESITAALARIRKKTKLAFLSKGEHASRASATVEALTRKEMEAERIDRLRHPSNYQGR